MKKKNKIITVSILLVLLVGVWILFLSFPNLIPEPGGLPPNNTTQYVTGPYSITCPTGYHYYDGMVSDFRPSTFDCDNPAAVLQRMNDFKNGLTFKTACYGVYKSPNNWLCDYNFYCCAED